MSKHIKIEYCPSREGFVIYNREGDMITICGRQDYCGFKDNEGKVWDSHDCEHSEIFVRKKDVGRLINYLVGGDVVEEIERVIPRKKDGSLDENEWVPPKELVALKNKLEQAINKP